MKASSTEPVVSCRGVTKVYNQGRNEVYALRGADLDVFPGQMTVLVGPSGCGKTTLLSIIAGILALTDGQCVVMGRDLSQLSDRQKTSFRRRHIGFVFQQYNLLPALTAAENAAVPLIVAGVSRAKAIDAGRQRLHEMAMSPRADAFPTRLSGGEQQRVAIARALIHEPQLIVCDEPTSALDAKTGRATMDLLRHAAVQANRAVVVVTHDPRVLPFADRIVTLEDGQVTGEQTPPDPADVHDSNILGPPH
jgi:putative ABC transport system ATP-binding protein